MLNDYGAHNVSSIFLYYLLHKFNSAVHLHHKIVGGSDHEIFFLAFCISLCPTFGGSNPGVRAELIHSLREELSVICGCALVNPPSAFASISVSFCATVDL